MRKNRMKKMITLAASVLLSAGAMFAYTAPAHATTVDDVAEVARHYGYSEDLIMQAYNKYYEDPELYTSEDFDTAIAELHKSGYNLITTGPQNPDAFTTTTSATTTAAPATDKNGSTVTTSSTVAPKQGGNDKNGEITLTLSDGSTFTRMSVKDFIKLSYADKMAYISTFTPAQQQAIIDALTPEEYRSLLKGAPQDTKLNVIDELSKAADAMGMNITINEISDDSISVAMRNSSGELVGVANAGTIVEDTGYDRTELFITAGVLILSAAAGMAVLISKCFRKDSAGK